MSIRLGARGPAPLLTIRVPRKLLATLKALAKEHPIARGNVSDLVRTVLVEYVDQAQKR